MSWRLTSMGSEKVAATRIKDPAPLFHRVAATAGRRFEVQRVPRPSQQESTLTSKSKRRKRAHAARCGRWQGSWENRERVWVIELEIPKIAKLARVSWPSWPTSKESGEGPFVPYAGMQDGQSCEREMPGWPTSRGHLGQLRRKVAVE
jgi:hypothetical protein